MSYSRENIEYAFQQTSVAVGAPAQLALKYIRVGEIARAEEILNLAIEKTPDDAKLHELLGVLLFEYGDAFKGQMHLELAISLPACDETTLCNCAHVLRLMGDRGKALELYQEALSRSPACAEAHSGSGNLSYEDEDWQCAFSLYSKAVELASENASYYNNRGVVALKLGMVGQALLDFQQACKLQPINLHQINFADAYVAAGQVGLALEAIAQINTDGRDSSYFTVLGKIHARSGAMAVAIESFNRALELNEYNLDAYEQCAAAYYAVGDALSAQYCVRQCLDQRFDSLRYRYLACLYAIPIRETSKVDGKQAQDKFIRKVAGLQSWVAKTTPPLSALININFVAPLFFLYSADCTMLAFKKYQELLGMRLRVLPVVADGHKDAICIVTAKGDDTEYHTMCLVKLLQQLNSCESKIHIISAGAELKISQELNITENHIAYDLEEALDLINKISPKTLIYTDIGSNYLPLELASMRLAPQQLQTWNAGCGLFLETIDGVLAPEFMAGLNCIDVPFEKLIFYPQPWAVQNSYKKLDSQTNSFPLSKNISILCGANSLKYQSAYVELLLDMLEQHAHAHTYIANDYGYSSLHLKNYLMERATSRGLDCQSRIIFKNGDLTELLGYASATQALVLDSFPYSDFSTVEMAVALQIPVVAMRGPELHGQVGAQLLTAMGVDSMFVTDNLAEYAQLSSRLLADDDFYEQARSRLAAVKEWVNVDIDAAAGREGALPRFLKGM